MPKTWTSALSNRCLPQLDWTQREANLKSVQNVCKPWRKKNARKYTRWGLTRTMRISYDLIPWMRGEKRETVFLWSSWKQRKENHYRTISTLKGFWQSVLKTDINILSTNWFSLPLGKRNVKLIVLITLHLNRSVGRGSLITACAVQERAEFSWAISMPQLNCYWRL